MEIPKNEGSIHNKGRAFIEFSSIKEAKAVYKSILSSFEKILMFYLGFGIEFNLA